MPERCETEKLLSWLPESGTERELWLEQGAVCVRNVPWSIPESGMCPREAGAPLMSPVERSLGTLPMAVPRVQLEWNRMSPISTGSCSNTLSSGQNSRQSGEQSVLRALMFHDSSPSSPSKQRGFVSQHFHSQG